MPSPPCPNAWQTVLWHTEIEGTRPAEVARCSGSPRTAWPSWPTGPGKACAPNVPDRHERPAPSPERDTGQPRSQGIVDPYRAEKTVSIHDNSDTSFSGAGRSRGGRRRRPGRLEVGLRQAYLPADAPVRRGAQRVPPGRGQARRLRAAAAWPSGTRPRRPRTWTSANCREVRAELGDVNVALRSIVAPLILGPVARFYRGGCRTSWA